eukprot:75706-Pleurochrysis_carterae.AAC.1
MERKGGGGIPGCVGDERSSERSVVWQVKGEELELKGRRDGCKAPLSVIREEGWQGRCGEELEWSGRGAESTEVWV